MPQPVDYCRCSCTGRRQREQRQREEWQRSWGKNLSYQDFAKPSRFTPSTFLSLSYCFSLDYFLKRLLKIKPLFACNHFLACLCPTPHLLQRKASHDITRHTKAQSFQQGNTANSAKDHLHFFTTYKML